MTKKSLTPEERCLTAAVRGELEKDPMTDRGAFADKIGLSHELMTKTLNGLSRLSAGTWKKVCAALELDYDEICAMARQQTKDACAAQEGAVEAPVASDKAEQDCVVINAPAEELYRLYRFCEERMADNLKSGTRMQPEELYRLMGAMYALRDATLRLQQGELVEPPAKDNNGSGYNRKTVYD